jgi:hypothetical protein
VGLKGCLDERCSGEAGRNSLTSRSTVRIPVSCSCTSSYECSRATPSAVWSSGAFVRPDEGETRQPRS